ncbi:MAG: flagellar biosynthesis anti-sigma factor FlgM [Proteobacteria bacterium]|nr:flagellar biosynthesis anti-sigma factor FlgM [Pseudomonadota bacterium]
MKITSNKQNNVPDTLLKSVDNKPLKESVSDLRGNKNITDRVELSSKKQTIEKLTEKVKAIPVIRQEKVDQIKEAIKAETYNVKGELVARSILKSSILDAIL